MKFISKEPPLHHHPGLIIIGIYPSSAGLTYACKKKKCCKKYKKPGKKRCKKCPEKN